MYDTREKAIRDSSGSSTPPSAQPGKKVRQEGKELGREEGREEGREMGREEGREEGKILGERKGEIKLIQTLQELLELPISDATSFQGQSLEQLRAITDELRTKLQKRS